MYSNGKCNFLSIDYPPIFFKQESHLSEFPAFPVIHPPDAVRVGALISPYLIALQTPRSLVPPFSPLLFPGLLSLCCSSLNPLCFPSLTVGLLQISSLYGPLPELSRYCSPTPLWRFTPWVLFLWPGYPPHWERYFLFFFILYHFIEV